MTAETIAKVFNVFPHSIVLVGENGTVATPEGPDGQFCLYEMEQGVAWTVNGDPSKPVEGTMSRPSTSYAYQQPDSLRALLSTKAKWKPLATPRPPGVTKQEARKYGAGNSWTKTVEICRYDTDTTAIKKTFNLPLTLTEQTSSVPGVADIASAEAFGGEPVVIIDAENLRIPDSIGTRGKSCTINLNWLCCKIIETEFILELVQIDQKFTYVHME